MKKNTKKDVLIFGGLLLVLVTTIALFTIQSQRISQHRTDSNLNAVEANYAISQLTFCVDYAISPCNDEKISEWNSQNPNETFTLKSFETLVEEAIKVDEQ